MQTVSETFETGTIECIVASGKTYIEFVTSKPAFFDLMWGERAPLNISMKLWALAMGLSQLAINNHIERFVSGLDPYEMLTTSSHSFLQGVKQSAD